MPDGISRIGFIGVGGIGRPMAERLAETGYELIVCDKRADALRPFRHMALETTARASDCARADMVIVMVADDAQAWSVVSGDAGLLHGIDPDRPPLVAIMSTILPETVRRIAASLATKNAQTVDAPVSGGAVRASRGELSIIASGEAVPLAAMAPVFGSLGSRVFHCGVLGNGEAIKILNNSVAVTIQLLMGELAVIAEGLGLDLELLVEVMEASSGRSFVTGDYEMQKAVLRRIISDPALLRAHVDVCRKDLRLAQSLGIQQNVSSPLLDGVVASQREVPYEDCGTRWRSLSQQTPQ
ncbi:NAD(P)-dependent oxidoreductase [Rhizorhabdus dicambivorans]|nr:NAD(P)-dependent oxidoreductase [Rhizorhabdus dicambivorans]